MTESIQPNQELTARLDKAFEEYFPKGDKLRDLVPLAQRKVYLLEDLYEKRKTCYWSPNGYIYLTISFEDLIGAFNLQTPPIIHFPTGSKASFFNRLFTFTRHPDLYTNPDVVLTAEEKEKLGLEGDVDVWEPTVQPGDRKNIFQKAFGGPELVTVLDQPAGMMRIPGKFLDIIYKRTVERQGNLFVVHGIFSMDYNNDERFCIVHLAGGNQKAYK